ncbi:MAG: hypothetical protein P4L46_07485 [Fimbriimonas sp.]|nr:hypothetical protein [Fimbriimonas sp.]
MRYQDQVVRSTQKALDDVCRAALSVPSDRLEWIPMGDARSVLSQMQEVATAGTWFLPIVRDRKPPEFDEHARREAIRLRRSFDTIEKCVEGARDTTSDLCRAIAAFPDDALEDEMQLPFGGGVVMTMADVLGMHYWNMVYHLGQINQIQLLLGDREMH